MKKTLLLLLIVASFTFNQPLYGQQQTSIHVVLEERCDVVIRVWGQVMRLNILRDPPKQDPSADWICLEEKTGGDDERARMTPAERDHLRSLIATALNKVPQNTYGSATDKLTLYLHMRRYSNRRIFRVHGSASIPPELEAVRAEVHRLARKYKLEE